MYRVGIDAVSVPRIKKSLERPGFARRVFSPGEISAFFGEKKKYDSLAANFAAKEAFSKALGTGIRRFALPEVEVLRDGAGRPFFRFYGGAREIMAKRGLTPALSLTHEGDMAFAVVLLEETGPLLKNL